MSGSSLQLRPAQSIDNNDDDGFRGRQGQIVRFSVQSRDRIRENIGKAAGAGFVGG
ncbi:hypothetical protein GCM10011313_08390 [Mycetocola zhadangensis]|nr:hypothetical protein GCM10011313_08390 [Mycetocola zhadangensis]